MVVWGGSGLNTGGRYNLSTDSWTATSTTTPPLAELITRQYGTSLAVK